jgi:hypothetical protein
MVERRVTLPKMTVMPEELLLWLAADSHYLRLVAVVVVLRTTSGVVVEAEAAQVLLARHQLLVLEPMAETQPSKVFRRGFPLEAEAD